MGEFCGEYLTVKKSGENPPLAKNLRCATQSSSSCASHLWGGGVGTRPWLALLAWGGGGGGGDQNFRVGGSPTPPPPPGVQNNRGVTSKFTVNSYAGECCQLRHVQRCASRNHVIDNFRNMGNIAICLQCTLRDPTSK